MKNITILGWYGEQNLGDDAFEELFRQEFDGHNLTFLQTLDGYEGPDPDLIVLGGGGVVRGGYLRGLDRFAGKVPLVALGVDVAASGPDYEAWKKLPFDIVAVRSEEYAWVLQGQGIANVRHVPDLVFGLNLCRQTFSSRIEKTATVNLSQDITPKMFSHMSAALREMLKDGWGLVFAPLYSGQVSPDDKWNNLMAKELGSEHTNLIKQIDSTQHLLELYGIVDITIGMRFHSTIFSTIAHTPFVSVGRPGKQSLFCNQEALNSLYCNTLVCDGKEYILQRVNLAYAARKYWHGRFERISAKNKLAVEELFQDVRQRYLTV